MTYKELFKDYYAPNPIYQAQKNAQLYYFIQSFVPASKSVTMILATWDEAYNKQSMHPDELIKHLQKLGFSEWPDLEKFILAVDQTGFNFNAVKDIYDPPMPLLSEPEKMSAVNVNWHIRNTGFPIDPFKINVWYDNEYYLPTRNDLFAIIKANPSDRYKYIVEKRDCDDFTRIFLAWLSKKGHGNLATYELICRMNYTSGKTETHSMCLALTKEKEIWIFEPQDDNLIWKFGTPVKWPGVSSITPMQINE